MVQRKLATGIAYVLASSGKRAILSTAVPPLGGIRAKQVRDALDEPLAEVPVSYTSISSASSGTDSGCA